MKIWKWGASLKASKAMDTLQHDLAELMIDKAKRVLNGYADNIRFIVDYDREERGDELIYSVKLSFDFHLTAENIKELERLVELTSKHPITIIGTSMMNFIRGLDKEERKLLMEESKQRALQTMIQRTELRLAKKVCLHLNSLKDLLVVNDIDVMWLKTRFIYSI